MALVSWRSAGGQQREAQVAVDLIPLEVLFGNPERSSPQISPDGKRLAYLAPVDGVLNVWVGSTSGDDAKPVTADTGRGIRSYGWAHNGTHLFYIQDLNGDENWHLYTVDLNTNEVVNRTPFEGAQAQPAARSRRRPDALLIGINADERRFHDLYHLDLPSGRLEKRVKNPGFDSWLV